MLTVVRVVIEIRDRDACLWSRRWEIDVDVWLSPSQATQSEIEEGKKHT